MDQVVCQEGDFQGARGAQPAEAHFHPDRYLLGLIQRVVRNGQPARICCEAVDEILIDPASHTFSVAPENLALLSSMPAEAFHLQPWDKSKLTPLAKPRDLDELLWTAAYYASGGRLYADASKFDVIALSHWPNLSRLPGAPEIMRLCALLCRRQHTLNLARKLAGVAEEEAHRFYCAAIASGALKRLSTPTALNKQEPEPEPVSFGKTLGMLWQRLIKAA